MSTTNNLPEVIGTYITDLQSVVTSDIFIKDTKEDFLLHIDRIRRISNGTSMVVVYALGKACNDRKLRERYGMTIEDLAAYIGISRATMFRYKAVADNFSNNHILRLIRLGVPYKALLVLCTIKGSQGPKVFNEVLEDLLDGNIKGGAWVSRLKQVERTLMLDAISGYQMVPDAEPEDAAHDEFRAAIDGSIDVTDPAAQLMRYAENGTVHTTEDVDSDDCEDEGGDTWESGTSTGEPEPSSNTRAINSALKLTSQSLSPLNRNIGDLIENMERQLQTVYEMGDIVAGDDSAYNKYWSMLQDIAAASQRLNALLTKVVNDMDHRGMLSEI